MPLKLSQSTMSPSRIDPAPNNPNVMEPERYAALVESIRRFGFLQPVLVRPHPQDRRRFVACDGHHRVRAAAEVGLASIPVIVAKTTEAEANALQVAMNRLRGELDLSAVAGIVVGLQGAGWSPGDLSVLGFSADELADLIESMRVNPDVMPESIEPPATPTAPGAFVLEVEFSSRKELQHARRALRRAAGKGGSLALGLLNLLGED